MPAGARPTVTGGDEQAKGVPKGEAGASGVEKHAIAAAAADCGSGGEDSADDSVVCILVHGLGGSSDEAYLKNFATLCHSKGWRACSYDYWRLDYGEVGISLSYSWAVRQTIAFLRIDVALACCVVARPGHMRQARASLLSSSSNCLGGLFGRHTRSVPLPAGGRQENTRRGCGGRLVCAGPRRRVSVEFDFFGFDCFFLDTLIIT